MKSNLKKLVIAIGLLALVAAFAACNRDDAPAGGDAANYPTRDITVVVPWGAGGGTDLTVRSLAAQMEGELGTNMPILNMGGAGGSIGLQDVYDSPRDGYRILGTSMSAIATVEVMGLADVPFASWHVWNSAFTPNAIVVPGDSPFQTLQDLIDAMAASPNTITMGSAGPGSSGHVGGVVFTESAGVTFRHIPYEGGNPAILATLGGEVDFNAQLLSEVIDHIRSGDLRALATLSDQPIEIDVPGGSSIVIPSAGSYVAELGSWLPLGGSFGIMAPVDTPDNIVAAIDTAYAAAVASAEFAEFAADRGKVVVGMNRTQSAAYVAGVASRVGWTLWDSGAAPVDPASLGIPRP